MTPSTSSTSAVQGGEPVAAKVEEKPVPGSLIAAVPLMGLAMTMILLGLSNLPSPYGAGFLNNWAVYGVALVFGGLSSIIVGVLSIRGGNAFLGVAFWGIGAFWVSFVFMFVLFSSVYPIHPLPLTAFYGVAGFWCVCSLFTLTMVINAPRVGWWMTGFFALLFLAFALLTVQSFQLGGGNMISDGESWTVGGEIILTGLFAWLVATMRITSANYGWKLATV